MYFVTTGDVKESIRRIKARAYRGGHSASEGHHLKQTGF